MVAVVTVTFTTHVPLARVFTDVPATAHFFAYFAAIDNEIFDFFGTERPTAFARLLPVMDFLIFVVTPVALVPEAAASGVDVVVSVDAGVVGVAVFIRIFGEE